MVFCDRCRCFLGNTVLRYAQYIPAVRHLAISLASRHRDTLGFSTDQEAYASTQYALALRDLNHTIDAGADLLLICAFLMAVYDHFDPKAMTSSGLVHHNAAHRILNDPSTPWTWVTEAVFFHAQQTECVVSIFKHPIILPSNNSRFLIEPEIPVLPECFSTIDEMISKFFAILRWRFAYAAFHEEWTSTCYGFVQVLRLMEAWNSLVSKYLEVCQGAKSMDIGLRMAITISVQFRMIYTALWYSVDKGALAYPHPAFANLVDLSDAAKVVVLVPVKLRPYFHKLMRQPVPTEVREAIGIWPVIDRASFAQDPMYIRFTFNHRLSRHD
jgi:hypothetical protein